GFYPGASPGGNNKTHGHVQDIFQDPSEKIGRSTKFRSRFGTGHLPGTLYILPDFHAGNPVGGKHSDVGLIGVKDRIPSTIYGLTVVSLQWHDHIGLAGTNPHFTDHHILQYDFITTGYDQGVGTARRRSGHVQLPLAGIVGPGGGFLTPISLDRDVLTGVIPPPYGYFLLLLQDHVVGKKSG